VIEWPANLRMDVAQEAENLDALITATQAIDTIQTSLAQRWQALHTEPLYAKPTLQFTVGELEDVLRRVQIGFGPTPGALQDNLNCLSDGMKSLFYFALVTAVFDVERAAAANALEKPGNQDFDVERLAPPALTVLAVEEPENHVAPQLLGRIMQLLQAVALAPEGQVVLTSHSPGILSRVDPSNVRYLRLAVNAQQRTTEVRAIILPQAKDEAHKYVKEAVRAYPELYFAQLVILGEGDSEEIVIPRILRSAGIGLDAKAIAVVPLGGRHVNHLWKLLAGLSIPHVTLLDLDIERDGGGTGRIRTACKELIAIGVPRSPLLDTKDGQLTDDELAVLDLEPDQIPPWLDELENHGVFFSGPLDIDLLMLEAYPDAYKATALRGPQLPKAGTQEYETRLQKATRRVLGDEGGDGSTYAPKQHALFPWYSYLFLGRGKPATHVLALTGLDDAAIEARLPAVLKRLRKRIVDNK
jgi:putative ATP-dependent endonuclease of the OLD family